jgi:hypothetical protein
LLGDWPFIVVAKIAELNGIALAFGNEDGTGGGNG